MHTALIVTQTIISVLLILVILVQNKSSGLSSTFGGGGSVSTTKRGPEKIIFNATIILAVLFICSSIAFIFVR